MNGLDWPGMMRAGLRDLGLRPWEFWRLTPVELLLMLGIEGASAPLNRARLEQLAMAFPDLEQGNDDGGRGCTERPAGGAGIEPGGGTGGDRGV